MPERRDGDSLIIKMSGNIERLLERTQTMAEVQEAQNRRFIDLDKRTTANEGEITGIKWIGGAFSVVFGGLIAYFKR